ncbi:hypothetical protein EV421DRAFT_1448666 [Armillaria borealis]|uniref:Uncharacterized protein n=1 Tax=Armillaria borealis TaxID=47425 RepID=A0AA39J1Z7_9AGAR|nr:hypothetical protein EV421DRAFT_1448666 [Armillaria borealis]
MRWLKMGHESNHTVRAARCWSRRYQPSSPSSRPESTLIMGLQTIPFPSLSLLITNYYDFGMASATSTIYAEEKRRTRRCDEKHLIVNPTLSPRRVWESEDNKWYRNRQILPAWMDEMDHVSVRTPVDEYKWPVPALSVLRYSILKRSMHGWFETGGWTCRWRICAWKSWMCPSSEWCIIWCVT